MDFLHTIEIRNNELETIASSSGLDISRFKWCLVTVMIVC